VLYRRPKQQIIQDLTQRQFAALGRDAVPVLSEDPTGYVYSTPTSVGSTDSGEPCALSGSITS